MRFWIALFYVALYALLQYGAAQTVADINQSSVTADFSRFGENSNSCNNHQFRCRSGQCVKSEALCDGIVDCLDHSDETREECSRSGSPPCGAKTFRCDYGACVDGDAPCNGVKDCADNSDETLPRCKTGGGLPNGAYQNGSSFCSSAQYRCDSGQCIPNINVCDGRVDCLDRSDETLRVCQSNTCLDSQYQCMYGACIHRNFLCNGVPNCADNSDETAILCKQNGAQTLSRCAENDFRCTSGQCIHEIHKCDGRIDCLDKSDETLLTCQSNFCARHLFRCAYGACVDSDAPCNGVPDCADNSDETSSRCIQAGSGGSGQGDTTFSPDQSGRACSRSEFRCDSGQCIPNTDLCDGQINCLDRSDESAVTCGSYNCPQHVFRCAYGACVAGDAACNGKIECADGSDEDRLLCNDNGDPNQTGTTAKNPYITNTGKTTQRPAVTNSPLIKESCDVPEQPDYGRWQLEKSQCSNSYNCIVPKGTKTLDPGTQLVYMCDQGYKLNGIQDVFCGRQGKWSTIPKCEEIRCPPLSTAAREAQCTYEDSWVSCDSPVLPRTTAQLSCRNSYTQDTTDLTRFDIVKCNADGEWQPKPIQCISVCGVATIGSGTPLIVNGSRTNVSDFPWHATLYKIKGQEKEFICGATIIKDNLLITAAHCVYDEVTKQVDTPSKFYIAAGNVFRDYDYKDHDPLVVKKARVQFIHIVCNYLGLEGNYASDIAILQIDKPFVFSSLIMPVCLDTNSASDQAVLEAGNYGKVAGFGRTAKGESSFILQSITVPYVSLNTCKYSSAASDSERYITIDKFCAGYSNGSSVCDGDSGGGLVFKTDNKWYIRGIVSVGIGAKKIGATRTCDSYAYSLYTRISSHMEWIQDVILRVETKKPYQHCR